MRGISPGSFDLGQWPGPGADGEGSAGDLPGEGGEIGEDFAGADGTLSAADDLQARSAAEPARADGLADALVQASFVTMAVLTKVAADHDLSLTQLRVLAILRDRRVRMTALADYLGLEK